MNEILIEPHYLPSLEYFTYILSYKAIKFEKFENYIKQSYRNRCHILTSQKIDKLIVPVQNNSKHNFKDTLIDNRQKWIRKHWNSIKTSYSNAPFFEYYYNTIKKILFKEHKFLFDLNVELISSFLEILQAEKQIKFTDYYNKVCLDSRVKDGRNIIDSKSSFQGRSIYKPARYIQTFGNRFSANLSIIDLIFCQGPRARLLL